MKLSRWAAATLAGEGSGNPSVPRVHIVNKQEEYARARYVRAPAWPVEPSDIVDTTGAGDCFMAAIIYGMTHRLGIAR